MISQGDGDIGAAKLANEVIEIMNKINASAQVLTGRTAAIIVSLLFFFDSYSLTIYVSISSLQILDLLWVFDGNESAFNYYYIHLYRPHYLHEPTSYKTVIIIYI